MRTTQNDREFLRPPEEYPSPAAHSAPLPPEFGSGGQDAPSAKKKRRLHWLAAAVAAGLLSTVAMFSDVEKAILEPLASPTPRTTVQVTVAPTPSSASAPVSASTPAPTATPSAAPSPTLDHTPSPSPAPTAVPTPVPTATPTPTPEPTATPKPTPVPATTPDAELTFYHTSEVYHGSVVLEAQDKMTAVTVRLWDRVLEETMWEHPFTAEDIAHGRYGIPDFDLGASEFAKKHWDQLMEGYMPDPILEVAFTVRTETGEEVTHTKRAEAAYELWISGRYDLKDPNEDFLHTFMEETTYPDCFVVRIDPSPYGELNMIYGEDVQLQPGDVAVILKADGQVLSGDGWHMERTEIVQEEGTFYAYALVIPRPESLPEHGTVEISITRKLIHYPTSMTTDIHSIEY